MLTVLASASGIPATADTGRTPEENPADTAPQGQSAPSGETEAPPGTGEGPADTLVILEGQVINQIGAGHADVTVTVHYQSQDGTKGDLIATAVTDEIGDFTVTSPEPIRGKVMVTFSAPTYTDLVREVRLGEDDLPPYLAEQLEGNLAIAGRVVSALADKPVAGASVNLRSLYRDWQTKTDHDGRFAIKGVTPGEGELVVEASGFGREVQPVTALENAGEILVRIKPERIVHLLVLDDNHSPIPGVTIESYDEPRDDFRTLVTDDDGSATLRGVHFDAQFIGLRLTHEDHVSSEGFDREIVAPADQTESRHSLTMTRAGRIAGKVTDARTETPLNGARLLTGTAYADYSPRDWTDYQGMYTIQGVKPGPAVVTVHLFGYAPGQKTIEVKAGETTRLDVRLEPGATLEGIVKTDGGEPVPGVQVETGQWRGHTTLNLRAMTDRLGRFTIENAPHDEFEIMVAVPGGPNVTKMVKADPNNKVELVTAAPATSLKIGNPAPALGVTTLDGVSLDLAQLEGKTILLDFWATWCGPCIAELPDLAATYDKFGSRDDFVMIGVSLDTDEKSLREFLRQREVKWHQVFGETSGAGATAQKFGVIGVPAIFVIGPDGKIAAKGLRGSETGTEVEKVLRNDNP